MHHLQLHGVWPAALSLMRSLCSWEGVEPRLTVHMHIAVPELCYRWTFSGRQA